jgi:hypothetical protein
MYIIEDYQVILYILDFVSLTILFSFYFFYLLAYIYIYVPPIHQWTGGALPMSGGF